MLNLEHSAAFCASAISRSCFSQANPPFYIMGKMRRQLFSRGLFEIQIQIDFPNLLQTWCACFQQTTGILSLSKNGTINHLIGLGVFPLHVVRHNTISVKCSLASSSFFIFSEFFFFFENNNENITLWNNNFFVGYVMKKATPNQFIFQILKSILD